jgi:two-component system response regulator
MQVNMLPRPQSKPIEKCIVLHVEDDDDAANLFRIALQQANPCPEVIRVTDGEQALAFLSRNEAADCTPEADLVVLDLNLPRKNGFDVLAERRRDLAWLGVPRDPQRLSVSRRS